MRKRQDIGHRLKTEIEMSWTRPWSVWWDFRWEDDKIKYIVVQTDHPKYAHLDYIHCFDIKDCEDAKGYIDTWVETWYSDFVKEIKRQYR